MTAEIIIMNSGAIALAADSAATSSHGWGREKVFSSDNKIFELTDNAQVAVMNYGSADFMSIPWETVVGEYRRRHGGESFAQLQDYMDAFLRFLREEMTNSISVVREEKFVVETARAVFGWIASKIQEAEYFQEEEYLRKFAELEDEDSVTIDGLREELASERQEIPAEIVSNFYQGIQEAERVSETTEEIIQQASSVVKQALPELFEIFDFDMDGTYAGQLEEIAYASIVSMTDESSGIVLAGFGDDNLFPGHINVEIEGIYKGMLKWVEVEEGTGQIAMPPKASIAGFAQMDEYLLAAGLDRDHFQLIAALAREQVVEYTRQLIREISGSSGDELEESVQQKSDQIDSVVVALLGGIDEDLRRDPGGPIDDILEVVSVLPKDQLAEVAGAAIGFTSLRRRVSLETETVGGPTDVAVITKNDGLVWVRRKQYFDPGLNSEYLARMSRKGS